MSATQMAPSRAVVTGGAGFIGHHLVRALTAQGVEVVVLDDLSAGVAERLAPSVRLERLDITTDDLATVLALWRPATVFHLAAQVSVPRSEADPEHDLRVNGVGTLRLVAAARTAAVQRIVFTSSGGAIYGETPTAATERSRARPNSAYGMHKLLAEWHIARSGLAYAIVRPSNVYGPGQDAVGEGAVIAAFTDAARRGRPLVIHGDGSQERDFVHVADLVEALALLAGRRDSGTWNVSAGASTSIAALATLVERAAGRNLDRSPGPRRSGDVRISRITSRRLSRLGWAARRTLDQAIGELIASQA